MSKLQRQANMEQANMAWNVLSWTQIHDPSMCEGADCLTCPARQAIKGGYCDKRYAKAYLFNWLHVNGFPASRPRIHTVAELAKQAVRGRKPPCLAQWITQNVEAVACPDCGKHTLFRERRMVCTGCDDIYPADKWAAGEPCGCGSMDARYFGIHSANQIGQLEFQQCQTPGCRWGGDYRRLTVQELANAAQDEADEQWAAARTCPACGDASGDDQIDGVYLPIKSCACGWIKTGPEGEIRWRK